MEAGFDWCFVFHGALECLSADSSLAEIAMFLVLQIFASWVGAVFDSFSSKVSEVRCFF